MSVASSSVPIESISSDTGFISTNTSISIAASSASSAGLLPLAPASTVNYWWRSASTVPTAMPDLQTCINTPYEDRGFMSACDYVDRSYRIEEAKMPTPSSWEQNNVFETPFILSLPADTEMKIQPIPGVDASETIVWMPSQAFALFFRDCRGKRFWGGTGCPNLYPSSDKATLERQAFDTNRQLLIEEYTVPDERNPSLHWVYYTISQGKNMFFSVRLFPDHDDSMKDAAWNLLLNIEMKGAANK